MKKIINLIAVLTILAVAGIFLCLNFFMVKIELGQVGVRTLQYALLGDKGVEPVDYGAGWHRSIPMLDSWNVFDATVQTTEFTTVEERKRTRQLNRFFSLEKSDNYNVNMPVTGPERIELKSKDGYTVRLDVTVKYRVMPGEVHLLYRSFNYESRYKQIVRDSVQNTLRKVFGDMRTEEFYNPDVRDDMTKRAFSELSTDMAGNHIELIRILVRDIRFDDSYERKILDKKLADQDVELNKSRGFAEEKKGETNKIVAETQAMVLVIEEERKASELTMQAATNKQIAQIRADADLKSAKIRADANLYAAELEAKGRLLEKNASAEGERLKAIALQGSGGANIVALELVEKLELESLSVSTIEKDFLDVNAVVKQLGASVDTAK